MAMRPLEVANVLWSDGLWQSIEKAFESFCQYHWFLCNLTSNVNSTKNVPSMYVRSRCRLSLFEALRCNSDHKLRPLPLSITSHTRIPLPTSNAMKSMTNNTKIEPKQLSAVTLMKKQRSSGPEWNEQKRNKFWNRRKTENLHRIYSSPKQEADTEMIALALRWSGKSCCDSSYLLSCCKIPTNERREKSERRK